MGRCLCSHYCVRSECEGKSGQLVVAASGLFAVYEERSACPVGVESDCSITRGLRCV